MRRIRILNKVALCASTLALLVSFAKRNELPSAAALVPALAAEPRQGPTAKKPFTTEYSGVRYSVEPQYEYELLGLIVSYRRHDGDSAMHRRANDRLNVADLCVVWGDTAASPHLAKIEFWNGIFTCNFQTSDSTAWASIRPEQVSNNHLISADDIVREQITGVGIGDQIRLRGWLASYGNGAGKRGTSTTREDTGDGACETIFVEELEVMASAPGHWRAGLVCFDRGARPVDSRALPPAVSAVRLESRQNPPPVRKPPPRPKPPPVRNPPPFGNPPPPGMRHGEGPRGKPPLPNRGFDPRWR